VFGYLVHTQRTFLQVTVQRWHSMLALAMIIFPLSVWLSALDNAARGGSVELHLYAVLINALNTWTLIYVFIGGALRFFDRPSAWIDYIAQSSYWVFLVHLPLVCLAGWWLVPYDLPALVKFALVCGFSATIALLSFHYCVQKTWISVFLHGRRFDLAWPLRRA
jgi:glucans biosynthesis protein C